MIKLSRSVTEDISEHALLDYPDECCGFFYGVESEGNRYIIESLRIHNSREGDKRRRFEISPWDYLKAEAYAEKKGLTLFGIYHSHPDHPSVPSEHDRVAAQPFFSYVILSVTAKEVKSIQSWLLNEDFQFEEEKVIYQKNSLLTQK